MNMVITPKLFAETGIFGNTSTSRQIISDIKFCKENYPKLKESYYLSESQVNLLSQQKITLLELNNGLEKDKIIYKSSLEDIKKDYLKCTEDLNKCSENKPSRFTWFSAGMITTVVLGLATIFMIK